jgi:hypothetical protein
MANKLLKSFGFNPGLTISLTRFLSHSVLTENFYNNEQKELMKNTKKFIDLEINPYAEQWEREKSFPAHEVRNYSILIKFMLHLQSLCFIYKVYALFIKFILYLLSLYFIYLFSSCFIY